MKKPNSEEIEKSIVEWKTLENYVLQESSLNKLFFKTYPTNDNIDDVLIKVCALNNFYSTNIFSPFTVAKHIISLNIDHRLNQDDLSLVSDVALIKMPNNKVRNFYSFASKYCSHHKPEIFPIYDSFAEKMLLHFNAEDNFHSFKKEDLKNYGKYKEAILKFQEYYSLEKFNLKEIDRYLWIRGKDYFKPKN